MVHEPFPNATRNKPEKQLELKQKNLFKLCLHLITKLQRTASLFVAARNWLEMLQLDGAQSFISLNVYLPHD